MFIAVVIALDPSSFNILPPVDVSKNISNSELTGSVSKTHRPVDTVLPELSKVVTLASPDGFCIDCTEVKAAYGGV